MTLNLSKIRSLVTAFENARLRTHHWNHRTRLILGLWYVLNPDALGPKEALRRGITRLETTQRRPLTYDDRTTAFYLQRIEAFALVAPSHLSLVELMEALLVSELAQPRLHQKLTGLPGLRGEAGRNAPGYFVTSAVPSRSKSSLHEAREAIHFEQKLTP